MSDEKYYYAFATGNESLFLNETDFAVQGERKMTSGWICPKCGKVYAPFVTACVECNGNQVRCDDCGRFAEAGEMLEKKTIRGITYHLCVECREKAIKAEEEAKAINLSLHYKAPDRLSPFMERSKGEGERK